LQEHQVGQKVFGSARADQLLGRLEIKRFNAVFTGTGFIFVVLLPAGSGLSN